MAQHFLHSSAAKSLSIATVARMSEEEAWEAFRLIRWSDTQGEPVCPRCGCLDNYRYRTRKVYRCKGCSHQFTVTSATIFASRKLAIRDYLLAIAIFVNGVKGHSALQLSRDLSCNYKTAYVLAMKVREAVAAETDNQQASGEVEVDGGYFGGYVKPANLKENRRDRRFGENKSGKRRVVIVMRERNGKTLPFVSASEGEAVATIRARVAAGSTIYADEAAHWDQLHARSLTKRINHSEAYADGDTSTNMAESFFSRLRRAEIGIHHHIAGPYLSAYANEMAWREDNRRVSNGVLYLMATDAALKHPVSKQWCGYWQRSMKNAARVQG
jgi:transposase-like protein